MAIFIILFLIVVALSHLFVYVVLKMVFTLPAALNRLFLVLSILMPILLFSSLVIARKLEHPVFRFFYQFVMLWHGWLINLLVLSLIIFTLFYLKKFLFPGLNLIPVYYSLLLVSVVLIIYGVFNAYHPRVKNLQASIDNLPASWQNQKIVHLSDVHLGLNFRQEFFEKIIRQINAQKPKVLAITGDLFDGSHPADQEFLTPLKNLDPAITLVFVYGNHEIYGQKEISFTETFPGRSYVLKNQIAEIDGLNFIGLDYIDPNLDLLNENNPKSLASVLLYHEPKFVSLARKAGINLQLAGHTHHGQQFPANLITRLIYGRYHSGFHTQGAYNINTSNGTGAWGPPVRIGNTPEIGVLELTAE